MLRLNNVRVDYGKVTALKGISLILPFGQIATLLGANGAGKSTALRAISGLVRPSDGSIEFEGKRIDALSPSEIVRLGISQSPEGREIFTDLTVRENLIMGAYTRNDRKEVKADLKKVLDYFPVLAERQQQISGTLSGGEQQMLCIGRSLLSKPRYLLLDEPSLGLAPKVVRQIFDIIKTINQTGVAILLVEQNVNLALRVAKYAYILETGSITLEGETTSLHKSELVRKAYLGGNKA